MKLNLMCFFKSFKFAFQGIFHAFKTQRNLRFHLFAAVAVFWLAGFYGFSDIDYAVLLLTVSAVIVSEMINTAVEAAVDLSSPDFHRLAKIAKDTAAGAVLLACVSAVVVGFFMFWDIEVFSEIAAYFADSPLRIAASLVYLGLMGVFIFREYK